MTIYTVYFSNDNAWAFHDIEADTPEQALALARKHLTENSPDLNLWFEPYEFTTDANEIVVRDEDGDGELALWRDEELRLRLAAQALFNALEMAVAALNEAPRFAVPALDTDSYAIAAICDRALAEAKGGAA